MKHPYITTLILFRLHLLWSGPLRHLVELPFQQRRQGPCHVFSAKEQALRSATGQLKGGTKRGKAENEEDCCGKKSTEKGILWIYLPQGLLHFFGGNPFFTNIGHGYWVGGKIDMQECQLKVRVSGLLVNEIIHFNFLITKLKPQKKTVTIPLYWLVDSDP